MLDISVNKRDKVLAFVVQLYCKPHTICGYFYCYKPYICVYVCICVCVYLYTCLGVSAYRDIYANVITPGKSIEVVGLGEDQGLCYLIYVT